MEIPIETCVVLRQITYMQKTYYIFCTGFKGFVAKVIKNDSVRGGSARPEFVKKHYHSTEKVCFCFPVPFGWTNMFCPPNDDHIPNMKGTFINVPTPPSTTTTNVTTTRKYNDHTISCLTSSDLSVGVVVPNNTITNPDYTGNNNNNSNNNPKILSNQHSSSMISYNKRVKTHYALKSIILDQCSTPELKEELKNEGSFVLSYDDWCIVFLVDTFIYGMTHNN